MTTIGIDPGSAHTGIVAARDGRPVIEGATVDVDPDDVTSAVDEMERAITESGADRVVIEWTRRGWMPAGVSAQAAQEMMNNRCVMVRQIDRVEVFCKKAGVPVVHIAPATWRSRIGVVKPQWVQPIGWHPPLVAKPMSRAWVDGAVRDALAIHLGESAALLRDVHQRDAFGAILGDWLARVPVVRARRLPRAPRTPRDVPAIEAPESATPTTADRILDAMATHARPIRLDVLAVRLAVHERAIVPTLRRMLASSLILRPSRGIYTLPPPAQK